MLIIEHSVCFVRLRRLAPSPSPSPEQDSNYEVIVLETLKLTFVEPFKLKTRPSPILINILSVSDASPRAISTEVHLMDYFKREAKAS